MKYFLDKTITLRRLKYLDATRSVFSATGTADGYLASWQEPSPDRIQLYDGQIGNLFEVYVEISCPVSMGDEVVRAGKKYKVRDIKVMDFGSTQYKRVAISDRDNRT